MSAPIKLTYFDAPALGEPIRFILAYGKMNFIDNRLTREQITELKPTFPMGQVPVLEIEGKILCQTKAICRFLARKVGLEGKTPWDAAECDMMVDTVDDLRSALSSFYYEQDEKRKAEKKKTALSTSVPFFLGKLEERVSKNGGHFVNGQLTWADFYFASMLEYLCYITGNNIVEDRPSLKSLREKVIELPGVKEYMAKRPIPFAP